MAKIPVQAQNFFDILLSYIPLIIVHQPNPPKDVIRIY